MGQQGIGARMDEGKWRGGREWKKGAREVSQRAIGRRGGVSETRETEYPALQDAAQAQDM